LSFKLGNVTITIRGVTSGAGDTLHDYFSMPRRRVITVTFINITQEFSDFFISISLSFHVKCTSKMAA